MLFSCKISSAILSYLEREGIDHQDLLESTLLPEEFLRDPSYWMNASELEGFLARACQMVSQSPEPVDSQTSLWIIRKIGHAGPSLRPWGLLDSVLRMMPKPQEILAQPGRFLSYFVSPEPPVENIEKCENGLAMDVPISSEMYPLCTEYLRAAFEVLPEFVGKPKAICEWKGIHLQIKWDSHQQDSIFSEDPGHQLSPELLRSIVASLESHQRELQKKNSELQAHNETLLKAQRELEGKIRQSLKVEFESASEVPQKKVNALPAQVSFQENGSEFEMTTSGLEQLRHQFARLSDYMVRAQQLITIMVGVNRASPVIKEAMKRVDWERVQRQFPETIELCQRALTSARAIEEMPIAKNPKGELNV